MLSMRSFREYVKKLLVWCFEKLWIPVEDDFALLLLTEDEAAIPKKSRCIWVQKHFEMRPVSWLGEFNTPFHNLMDHPETVFFFHYIMMSYTQGSHIKCKIKFHDFSMIGVKFPGLFFLFIYLCFCHIGKVTNFKVFSCFLMKRNCVNALLQNRTLFSILIKRMKRAMKKMNPKDIQTGISHQNSMVFP